MTPQTRLNAVLNRLSAATSVQRSRAYDAARAERNGQTDERLEAVISRLEAAADELWSALRGPELEVVDELHRHSARHG